MFVLTIYYGHKQKNYKLFSDETILTSRIFSTFSFVRHKPNTSQMQSIHEHLKKNNNAVSKTKRTKFTHRTVTVPK